MTQTKKILVAILFMLAILIVPTLASAQFDITPDGGNPDAPMSEAPIDGGLSLLVTAGVGYGAKKLKARKQKMLGY